MEAITATTRTGCWNIITLVNGYPADISDDTNTYDLTSATANWANGRVVKVATTVTGRATTH
jgi:hypothetical protein